MHVAMNRLLAELEIEHVSLVTNKVFCHIGHIQANVCCIKNYV